MNKFSSNNRNLDSCGENFDEGKKERRATNGGEES